ncbi:Ff.00g068720.m01.CDS01 [Fusarium sp. VM40]|nr:Ff.00g068720.m01.CDS01 [Fusarium sp. VM40]
MFMRNVLIAAVSLQALVEGVIAHDKPEKVTLTKFVTKHKAKPTAAAAGDNPYELPPNQPDEPEVTVIPTSFITDGTTIFVDETVTIPCSRCTASTAGDADAEVTSEVITTVISSEDGNVSDQTAEVTVIPTSYVTDGTTIFVDETVTIPCSKCAATKTGGEADAETTSEGVFVTSPPSEETTGGDSDAEGTSAPAEVTTADDSEPEVTVIPTSYITDGTTIFVDETVTIPCSKCAATKTGGDSDAAGTSEAVTEAETLSTADATDSGFITEQTADITTVVPTSFITKGTTRFVDVTITIPCTKCAGGKNTNTAATDDAEETTAAFETTGATQKGAETSAPADETTDVEEATQPANSATDEVDASTEAATPIPTIILTTGNSQNTFTSQPGPFANTTVAAGAETTGADQLPSAVTSEAATSSAVISKVNKPVIVVIREVTIFHRTVVIGAACPPVKRGNKGDFVVGTGSEEQTFPEVGEALDDACSKQFKGCSKNAGKNFEVSDCQKQLEICRSDASSTAKAPTGDMKESTETASIVLPSDANVTGKDNKGALGGHVVISTRTLTVSESCVISGGTPVITNPASTDAAETTAPADAETTAEAEATSDAEAAASTALGAETSEAVTVVTGTKTGVVVVTMTNSDGEVSTTVMTLTNGVPTGTGTVIVPGNTEVESSAEAVPTSEAPVETIPVAETTAVGEGSSALGVGTTDAETIVTETKTGVVVITMTKSDGEISVTSMTLSNALPTGTGTGVVVVPGSGDEATAEVPVITSVIVPSGADQTSVEAPAETTETAIGQETTVVDKTVTKTITNQVTSYVTVGVNTATVGVETITKTLTNEVTETVTLSCGGGQNANVVTSVVTMCPAPTTMATTQSREPETVYVTATVEALRMHSSVPAPERFRRMLGFW